MTSKVKVARSTRLAIAAEKEIESRLACFAKVTKEEVDVGIDFRCELLENDSPSIPFFVQAKGTQHFDNKWGRSIKKSTVIYWLEQPFPVYLIVYDQKSGNCYWGSIEDQRYSLLQKLSKKSDTIHIKLDRSHFLERGEGKNKGLVRKIKEDLASVELWRGRPLPKGEGYVKTIPDPPRSKIELVRIKENIRQSLYSLFLYYFLQRDLENAYLLCEFLTKFDKSHYNHFVWFGQINKALGKKQEAERSFVEALKICERDKNWPRESMEPIVAFIRKEIERCK